MTIFKNLIVVLAMSTLLLLHAYWNGGDVLPSKQLIVSGWVGLIFLILIFVLDVKEKKSFDVVQLYLFGTMLRVGIGGIYSGVMVGSEFQSYLDTMGYLPIDKMPVGLLLMQIGALSTILGFSIRRRRKPKILDSQVHYPPMYALLFTLFICFAYTIMTRKGFPALGVLGYVIRLFPDAILFIFSYLAVTKVRGRGTHIALSCLIVFVQYFLNRSSSMREVYAFMILPIVFAFATSLNQNRKIIPGAEKPIIKKKNNRGKLVLFVVFSSIVLYLMITLILPAATKVKRGAADNMKAAIFSVINEKADVAAREDFPDNGIYALPFRMSVLVVAPAIIMRMVEDGHKMENTPLENIAAGFVPRFLWKNKPIISKGKWFAQLLNPASWNTQTSIALTAPGELYWAYGWFGAVTLMFLLGVFLRYFWDFVMQKINRSPLAILAAIVLCQECIRWFESEFSRPVNLLIILFMMVWVSHQFSLRQHSRSRAANPLRRL